MWVVYYILVMCVAQVPEKRMMGAAGFKGLDLRREIWTEDVDLGVISTFEISEFLNSVRSLKRSSTCEYRKGLSVWAWAETRVSLRDPPAAGADPGAAVLAYSTPTATVLGLWGWPPGIPDSASLRLNSPTSPHCLFLYPLCEAEICPFPKPDPQSHPRVLNSPSLTRSI